MFSHVFIGVNDFDRAFAFYSALGKTLGLQLRFSSSERAIAGWQTPDTPRPIFVIGKPLDGMPATVGNGSMLALLATSRAQVAALYQAALEHGGTCEGPPGLRPQYHENYFGAYFRDPGGNKLCICCHHPE